MINGIHHIAISTGDLQRSLAFYRDLLGLEVIFDDASWPKGAEVADRITALKDSSARYAMLKAGNAMIEIFEYASPSPKTSDPNRPVCDHGLTHICLDVTDLDAEYERLTSAGMTFHCPPQDMGTAVRATYGRDPDGNVIELLEIRDPKSAISLG